MATILEYLQESIHKIARSTSQSDFVQCNGMILSDVSFPGANGQDGRGEL